MHKLQQKTHLPALFAGVLSIATASHAAVCTLPVPPPSGYVDTERSTNIPITVWRDYCRRVVVRIAANATPTNAIQVAFGRDRDNDGNLAPEETELILGVDCGERFVRSHESNHTIPQWTARGAWYDWAKCEFRSHLKSHSGESRVKDMWGQSQDS